MGEGKSFLVKCGELAAIIGRLTHRQMIGIWYLTSAQDGNTAVAGKSAILTGGACRNRCSRVEQPDERTVVVTREADESTGFLYHENRYELKEPYYIDLTHTVTAKEGHDSQLPCVVSWCCYMNSPEERGIHFLERGRWGYHFNPVHGQAAMLFPSALAPDDRFPITESDPMKIFDGERNFLYSDSGRTFDYPFYFGVIRGMVFMVMMDTCLNCRFFISPVGGGKSITPGQANPAWDLMWTAGRLAENESRSVRVRIAYLKPDTPNSGMGDTAVREFEKFSAACPIRDTQTK